MSTSLVTLLRRVCEHLHSGDARFPYISTTTSNGSATTLVDSGLAYSDADTDALGQAIIRFDETVTVAFSPAVTINEGAPFSATDTALTVNDVTGVTINDVLVIESERLLCTAKPGGQVLTVTRGIDGTTAAIHADGTAVTRSGPITGTITRIRAAGLTVASGTVTIQQKSGIPLSGTDYSIWKAINPAVAKSILNRVLRNKKREVIRVMSVLTDADMETAGVTNWTDVGTVTTKEKATTTAYVRHGTQSLHVIAGAANAGVRSASYPCTPSQAWLLGVTMRVSSGTWTVAAYDADGGANIAGASTTNDQLAWQTVFFAVSTPSACENLQVRVTAANSTEECYIDSIFLWPQNQTEFELPSWVEDPYDKIDIGYGTLYSSSAGTYLYTPEEGKWRQHAHSRVPIIDEAAAHPFRILLDKPVSNPLYLKAYRPFAELSSDSDTTTADPEGLVLETVWHIYDHLMRENKDNKDQATVWLGLRNDTAKRMFDRLVLGREVRPHATVSAGKWTAY